MWSNLVLISIISILLRPEKSLFIIKTINNISILSHDHLYYSQEHILPCSFRIMTTPKTEPYQNSICWRESFYRMRLQSSVLARLESRLWQWIEAQEYVHDFFTSLLQFLFISLFTFRHPLGQAIFRIFNIQGKLHHHCSCRHVLFQRPYCLIHY